MNILIDADGCPVVDLTLQIAKQFSVPVIILCDTSHQIEREGAQTLVFDINEAGSGMAGHSTFSTTADIYAHLDYKSKQGSAGVIANLLGESKLPK